MATSRFKNSRLKARIFKSPLQNRFVEMMPPLYPRNRINIMTRSWKGPLPAPFFACVVFVQGSIVQMFKVIETVTIQDLHCV
jgi:hypothetical protein